MKNVLIFVEATLGLRFCLNPVSVVHGSFSKQKYIFFLICMHTICVQCNDNAKQLEDTVIYAIVLYYIA